MSSSVTMPAGPPYSSITRAISVECVRSSERTTVRLAASGTAITWCMSECTSTVVVRGAIDAEQVLCVDDALHLALGVDHRKT